ncbi:MAG: CHASE2 domain-containing protein [Desulfobacterales bacterium]|nr:CHASE2 domain-containing protein [Desulfobacterales bacterium]
MMALKRVQFSTLILVVLFALAITGKVLFGIDPLQPFEYGVYDSMSRLRQRKAATQIIIVAIDDKSVQQIGSWPWPRSYIAEMIRKLSSDGTDTLGLTILYPYRELNPGLQEINQISEKLNEKPSKAARKILKTINGILADSKKRLNHDQKLISAVRSANKVVLPLRFSLENSTDSNAPKLSNWLKLNSINLKNASDDQRPLLNGERQIEGLFKKREISAKLLIPPYADLSGKAGALGHLNLNAEKDGVVRKIPLLIPYQGRGFLSFALQVVSQYSEVHINDIKTDSSGIDLKHRHIPVEKNHWMLIDYSGRNTNIQQFSFSDVISGIIPPSAFRNKIILLGITAEGISQRFKTPFHESVSAIEIEANVVENIVNGKYISRPSWVFALEIMALLYFGFFLLFVIPKVTPRIGALIIGIFLCTWIGSSVILFLVNGIWLKVLAPVILSLIGFALISGKRRIAEKQDENAQLNKSLGLALQGQGMLDMAFEKFLKCPIKDKSVQKLLYNLGLDFERKRMFNKALAVYRQILQAGSFKDVKARIKKLVTLEKTIVMSAGAGKKETTFLLQNGTTKPTLGRYEILKELGQGAMGTVYLGRDPSIQRQVAIKTLNYADIAADELNEIKARFFREAEAAGKLSHPNIVTIYDVGEDHDMAYIAMELINGNDLTFHCKQNKLMPVKRVIHIVSAVAHALGYAHSREVVHRDIKPANIMLMENDQVKVTDFGIARVMSSSKTQTGIIFGTPNYMSPEQIAGKKVDGRSDLFSLGVVFYELLTGEKPFTGDSMTTLLYAVSHNEYVPPDEIATKTPPCCVKIIDRMLIKGVSKRYQSATKVINDIRECLDNLS